MSPAFKKNLITTAIVIAGFILVAIVFSLPAFTGKILAASDYLNWKAVSEEARAYKEHTGQSPLWSNSMFGGMPSYTFYAPNGGNYVNSIHNFLTGFLPRPANFLFLAMISFFLLSSIMKMNKWLGAVGAIAFAFATYNCCIMATGHETKMMDIAYMPAVLGGLILLLRGRFLAGAVLFGISFSLAISAGHYQIIYYLLFILLAVGLGMLIVAIKKGQLKTTLIGGVIALAMIGLGAGSNLGNILPTLEYSKYTQRGGASELHSNHDAGKKNGGLDKDYAFGWSNGIGETFCILVPYLYGGSTSEDATRLPSLYEATGGQYPELPAYWGPQAVLAGPVYFGAIICFLFVLGMMLIRNPVKWWILGVCVFAVLLSVGDHFKAFNYFMFDHLPGLNKFRAPSTALVIPQFLFPLVAIWGLNEVLRGKVDKAEVWKKAKIAAIATGGLALVLGVLGSMFFDFTNPLRDKQLPAELFKLMKDDRIAMARNSGLLSAFFILAGAAAIWAYAKDKLKAQWFIAAIGLLIAADLMPVGHNYLRDKPEDAQNSPYKDKETYDAIFQPSPADQQILADKDPYYRVLDVTGGVFSDASTSFFHKSIGGYSAAKLENYQDILDVHMSKGFNSEVLNMLNTKYFIVPNGNQKGVIPNPKALGNGWFVSKIQWAKNAEEEIGALKAPLLQDTAQTPGFNAKETIVLRDKYKNMLQGFTPVGDSAATVQLTKYGLNDLSFQSNNSHEGLAIFSDVYYDKGWKAYIDGKESEILRADYFLRALRIPAGKHDIKFVFLPKSYVTGSTVAMICSVLLFGMLLVWVFFFIKKANSETGEAA